MAELPLNNRESWGGWISSKVATAEAALSTAFIGEPPKRSHSFHNLRAVAKANRLAALRQHSSQSSSNHVVEKQRVIVYDRYTDHVEDEVIPPLTRRASAIDLTLSHAWHAVRSAAVAAMATFEEPVQPTQQASSHNLRASTDPLATHQPTMPEKAHFDFHTEISDVTISASCSSADFSEHNHLSSTSHASLDVDNPCSPVCEHPRISTTSCNQHINTEHGVLNEVSNSTLGFAESDESDHEDHHEPDREGVHETSHEISSEQLKQLLVDFNTMFEQNGGAECVARVKHIGDVSLAAMREPQTLNEAVEKELNEAKLKLDNTLQGLECAVRSGVSEYSDDCDASAAAEGVIEETKENGGAANGAKRKARLLQDCTRLLAVFASKICACVLDRVESDKDEKTWNERVDKIGCVSGRGIPRLWIIARRFVEAVEGDGKKMAGTDEAKECLEKISKVADAAVEQVVQCVALAVAALQVEVCERAYECCG